MIAALIATFLLLTMGGEGLALRLFSEDVEKAVKEVVADEARAEAAEEIVKQGRTDVEQFAKRFEEISKGFRKADESQAAGLDALTPFMEQAIEERHQGQTAVIDRIFELRGQLTEVEWQTVFAGPAKEK